MGTMIRDFFSQENIKKWLLSQAKNASYTLLVLLVVSLWSIRTGLLELSNQLNTSYKTVQTSVELQSALLNRLLSVKKPSSSVDWSAITSLNERLKYNHDTESYALIFTDLQDTIILLSDTFNVEPHDTVFYRLTGLLSDSQKYLSRDIQHFHALNTLYEFQKQRFPHRYFTSFYSLPQFPNLSLPENFEHIDVISTLKEVQHGS